MTEEQFVTEEEAKARVGSWKDQLPAFGPPTEQALDDPAFNEGEDEPFPGEEDDQGEDEE